MQFDTSEINRLMKTRRSVYHKDYTGEVVSDDIINQMLANADLAPTHKLTQPWRFMVFKGEGLTRLSEFQASCYRDVTTRDGSFKEQRLESIRTKPLQSSHVISVSMKRDPHRSVPEVEEIGAVFCAVENMYLTAAAYGVGCYLSTGGVINFEEAKPFFGLNPEDRLLGLLYVGVPRTWPAPTKRTGVAEKVTWVA